MVAPTIAGHVIDGMPEAEYHARPDLSSSQARTLLDNPARYRHELGHPWEPTAEMQIGTCLHTEVLGTGQGYEVVDGNRNANAVKEKIADAEARGLIVLKSEEAELVRGMAAAVRAHPEAGRLLDPEHGIAERSIFWTDPETGVQCRGRLDFTLHSGRGIVDLKSTADASPAALPRHMEKFGYHVQGPGWYVDGAQALGMVGEDVQHLWVFVERRPPHFVTVARLDPEGIAIGRGLAAEARQIYRDCAEVDVWPGYPEHIITVSLPPWTRRSAITAEEPSW